MISPVCTIVFGTACSPCAFIDCYLKRFQPLHVFDARLALNILAVGRPDLPVLRTLLSLWPVWRGLVLGLTLVFVVVALL